MMRYLTFGPEKGSYKICILVNDIRRDEIHKAYIAPYGLDEKEIIVIDLHQTPGKKSTPVTERKAYITEVLKPTLEDLGVEFLIISDGDYFKTLTKTVKVDPTLGYMLDTEFGDWMVTYVPNYRTIFYDPIKVVQKIDAGINALKNWMAGTYVAPACDIIKYSVFPETIEEIEFYLDQLLKNPRPLTVDIEGFSLKHYDAGIGTIAFAWSKTEGLAFPVDILDDPERSLQVRSLLRAFFEQFNDKLIYHNIAYDVYVLIYQLFMDHLLDNEGLLHGLDVMLKNWDCTKLISYLATNSCAGNELGLKIQAQEYAGNYAVEDIKDIRKIPLPQLLQYNLVDTLSTWFVYEKNWPKLIADQQLDIYENIFKPAIVDIIQMQLTGMPLDMERVKEVKGLLEADNASAVSRMQANPALQSFTYHLQMEHVRKRNEKLKKKQIGMSDDETLAVTFNPNSDPQMQGFLYEHLHLPVISRTKNKAPSTDGDTIEKLKNHTKEPDILAFLDALMDYKAVDKILTSFLPAMEKAQQGNDGWYYLFGYFNLGGTVSGRLSSSKPNLQNLPANSKYAKLIKSCFKAPPGWFFCGIDFSSLEDRISALTTKDPNKLKVYTDGYDGHAMRAFAYFGDQMIGIVDTVQSINQMAEKSHPYYVFRQDSKAPTFALTYQGTYITLMNNCGFSEAKAKLVEMKYHELYKVSDDWVAAKLDQACKDGYITAAFGLRVRTPMLHQVIRGTSKTPFAAEAEGRTAGNALGQSWCLLNSRAGSEFMGKVRQSEHRHSIKPCAQIHDAQYFLVRDDIDVMEYANTHVVKACQWQSHPDIWHDEVKLGGEFSIFYPDWSQEAVIPNDATQTEIYAAFEKHFHTLAEKAAA
jgi:DNA polymerase-1